MLPLADRHFIDPSCPSGGQFYACSSDSLFLGCCEQQPCPNVCSAGALQPASFNSSFWNNFQDQTCPLNSKWFTCTSTHPPFMGCCKINPCENGGCPPSELVASYLSTSPDVAADFLSSSGAVSSATATSPRIATSAVASAASAATSSKPGAVSKGTIIGSSIGGAAGLVLVLALVAFLVRQRTKMSQARMAASQPSPTQMANPDMMPFQDPNSEHMTDKSKHGPFSASPGSNLTSMYSPAPSYSPHTTHFSEFGSHDSPSARFSAQPSYELPSPPMPSSPQPPTQPTA